MKHSNVKSQKQLKFQQFVLQNSVGHVLVYRNKANAIFEYYYA